MAEFCLQFPTASGHMEPGSHGGHWGPGSQVPFSKTQWPFQSWIWVLSILSVLHFLMRLSQIHIDPVMKASCKWDQLTSKRDVLKLGFSLRHNSSFSQWDDPPGDDLKYLGATYGCWHIPSQNSAKPSGFEVTTQRVLIWIREALSFRAPSPVLIIFLFMPPCIWGCVLIFRHKQLGRLWFWTSWPFTTQSKRLLLQPFWLPDPEASYHKFLHRSGESWKAGWVFTWAKMWHPKMERVYSNEKKMDKICSPWGHVKELTPDFKTFQNKAFQYIPAGFLGLQFGGKTFLEKSIDGEVSRWIHLEATLGEWIKSYDQLDKSWGNDPWFKHIISSSPLLRGKKIKDSSKRSKKFQ